MLTVLGRGARDEEALVGGVGHHLVLALLPQWPLLLDCALVVIVLWPFSPEEPELVQDCSQEREEEKAGEDCKDQDPQGDRAGFWWFKGQHLSCDQMGSVTEVGRVHSIWQLCHPGDQLGGDLNVSSWYF